MISASHGSDSKHPYLGNREAIRKVLRHLDLEISIRLDGLLQGHYRGLVPGHGSDLGEARIYQPGDDIRRIDWNVSARMSAPHVRRTIADRELESVVAVDLSPSLDFGTHSVEKRELAVCATAALGLLTARVGNRFGAELIFADHVESIPPRQGHDHVMHVLTKILEAPRAPRSTIGLASGIARLHSGHRRRGLRAIVSDFADPTDWPAELGKVAVAHQTLAVEIVDPRELDLPDIGVITVTDPETNTTRRINTNRRRTRERFAKAARDLRRDIADTFSGYRVAHLRLSTDRDWLVDVVRFVAKQRYLSGAR